LPAPGQERFQGWKAEITGFSWSGWKGPAFSCLETGGRAKENLALSPCGRLLKPPFAALWNKK